MLTTDDHIAEGSEHNINQGSKKLLPDMEFDGQGLTWGSKHYQATTGLGIKYTELQNKSNQQFEERLVPEGTYIVYLTPMTEARPLRSGDFEPAWGLQKLSQVCSSPGEVWNQSFARGFRGQNYMLLPADMKTKKSRDKRNRGATYYLHDSTKGPYSGCIAVSPLFFTDVKETNKSYLYIRVKYKHDKTHVMINKTLRSDNEIKRSEGRFHSKVVIKRDEWAERVSFDFSYFIDHRIEGQFSKRQGDHTTAYSIILSALEKRFSNKTIKELIKLIAFDRTAPIPTIHEDLMIFYYIYAKVDGHHCDHYLREKLQNTHEAYKRLLSGRYFLQFDDKNMNYNVQGTGADRFFKLFTDYIYNYLVCIQSIPLSAVYADPGEGSGGRGEALALQFLNNLNTSSYSEAESLGCISKIFDEKAIMNLLNKFSCFPAEIIAYQLMGLLSILEGYPKAKELFFEDANLAVNKAKLNNIAYVIFYYWKKETGETTNYSPSQDQTDRIYEALGLVAKLRSHEIDFPFLTY